MRSTSWSSTTSTVCKEVLGRHSKFSLVACCHLYGMSRLPGSYCRAMYSFISDIISEFLLSFKARCMLLSLHSLEFTNTKMVGPDMVVGCHECLAYLSWLGGCGLYIVPGLVKVKKSQCIHSSASLKWTWIFQVVSIFSPSTVHDPTLT